MCINEFLQSIAPKQHPSSTYGNMYKSLSLQILGIRIYGLHILYQLKTDHREITNYPGINMVNYSGLNIIIKLGLNGVDILKYAFKHFPTRHFSPHFSTLSHPTSPQPTSPISIPLFPPYHYFYTRPDPEQNLRGGAKFPGGCTFSTHKVVLLQ